MNALLSGATHRMASTAAKLSAKNPPSSHSSRLRSRRQIDRAPAMNEVSALDEGHGLDDDGLDGHVLVVTARGGRHRSDLVDHLHAVHDVREHRVARIAATGIQERVVLEIHEE